MRYTGMAISFGLLMIVLAGLGFWGGQALDRRLGSWPWLTVLGVLVGLGLAFYDLMRELSLVDRAERRRRRGTPADRQHRQARGASRTGGGREYGHDTDEGRQ